MQRYRRSNAAASPCWARRIDSASGTSPVSIRLVRATLPVGTHPSMRCVGRTRSCTSCSYRATVLSPAGGERGRLRVAPIRCGVLLASLAYFRRNCAVRPATLQASLIAGFSISMEERGAKPRRTRRKGEPSRALLSVPAGHRARAPAQRDVLPAACAGMTSTRLRTRGGRC